MKLQWSEEFSLGVASIDKDHREIFELFNRLLEARQSVTGLTSLSAPLSALKAYAVRHFSDEEAYMEQIGYPDLNQHQKSHAFFKGQVANLEKAIENHDGTVVVQLVEFLKDWLQIHILGEDQAIAQFAKKRNVAR